MALAWVSFARSTVGVPAYAARLCSAYSDVCRCPAAIALWKFSAHALAAPATEEYAHTDDREQVVSHGVHHTHVAGSHEKGAPGMVPGALNESEKNSQT